MMGNKFSISLVSPSEVEKLPTLHQEWDELLESSENLELLYQSPKWFGHLLAINPYNNNLVLGIIKDKSGQTVGIVPIGFGQNILSFDVSSYRLWKVRLRTASILGSQALMPQNEDIYEQLFMTLMSAFPEIHCIYLGSVPIDSFLWEYLNKDQVYPRNWIPQIVDSVQTIHALRLPETFDLYLSKLKRKKRYNLQRQVKLFQDHSSGKLELIRVELKEQISSFLEGAVSISRHSWQQRRLGTRIENNQKWSEKLKDLAERNLLRAYLLKCADKPCSFTLGYQFKDVYHYVEIAYDESFGKFSPGTVLLYLLIQDLIQNKPPKTLYFGLSDHPYKQTFGNIHLKGAQILLWRPTFPNRIKRASHLGFRGIVSLVKRYIPKEESHPNEDEK
jgi:CelD/BcsL family acetyltransferase involved in cellulose biosynthesis